MGGIAGSKSYDQHSMTKKILAVIVGVALFAAIVIVAWQYFGLRSARDPFPAVPVDYAEGIARRVDVALEDVETTWHGWFVSDTRIRPPPVEVIFFNGGRSSPCSGNVPVGGAFYCPIDDTVSIDLSFMYSLEVNMERDARMSTAIIAARLYSEHVMSELGMGDALGGSMDETLERTHALQADCITGVWAGLASRRLGNVPPGRYPYMISNARKLVSRYSNGEGSAQRALNVFRYANDDEREKAFQTGRVTRSPAACVIPL